MNPVIDTISKRVSLRAYEPKEISKEHMDLILESAIKAPTAGNMMMYSILKITDGKIKKRLSETCDNQPFIAKAPVVLVFIADMQKWYDYYKLCDVQEMANLHYKEVNPPRMSDFLLAINDAVIACQNAVIAAESLEIGSCYIGDIMENYEMHKELLNLPDYAFPACMVTLGYYPSEMKRVYADRFDLEYVVFEERYQTLDNEKLSAMFAKKEEKMPKNNPFQAKNIGQLYFMRKTSTEFFAEMDRSIKEAIKTFTATKD